MMLTPRLKPFNSCSCNRVKCIIGVFKDLHDLVPAYLTSFLYHHSALVLSAPASYSSFNSSKTLCAFLSLAPYIYCSVYLECSNSPLVPPSPLLSAQMSLLQGLLPCPANHVNLSAICFNRTLCFPFTALLINVIQQLVIQLPL